MAGRDRVMRVVYGDDHGCFRAVSPWVLAERDAGAPVMRTQFFQISVYRPRFL